MTSGGIASAARRARPWLWAGVAAMAVALFALSRHRAAPSEAASVSSADPEVAKAIASMKIPEFQLVDQDGTLVGREMFAGRWTVLEFGFSHCTMACPVLKQNLSTAMAELSGTPVRAVTISVDPAHDTPLRLRAYAQELGVDRERWSFLTEAGGQAGEVRRLVVDSLGFMLEADDANQIHLPGGGTMSNIAHPTRFLVIGPDVTVRGMYRGNDPGEVRQMVAHLQEWIASEHAPG